MRPAPALEALAGLNFNGVAFAAGMAMFDFGPQQIHAIQRGPRKGEMISLGTYSLHVQGAWRLLRGNSVIATHRISKPAGLQPAIGHSVGNVERTEFGNITLTIGLCRLDIVADNAGSEDWRLLSRDPEQDHLVWGDADVQA